MRPPHPRPPRFLTLVRITALLLLTLGGPLLLLFGTAEPAHAVPGDRPVDVVIASITPRVGAPGAPIEVTGILVNTSDVEITDLTIRLQRGPALQTRSDLADNDSDPVEVNDSSTEFIDLVRPLEAAGVLPFSYTTTPEELRLSESGAYPLLVNINGRAGSEPASRVGERVALLPYLATAPTTATELSWLWPLVSNPERNAAGVFTGTELATALGPGGRLDRALGAIESSPGPGGSIPITQPVTLAVDPELLEAASVLAGGDYQLLVDGQQLTSSIGSTDAASWLTRLRAVAVSHPVVALPYGDPDIVSLLSRGQGRAVERLLPDGSSGDLLQEILGVPPVESIAWPPDGSAGHPPLVELLREHGVTEVIADDQLTFEASPFGTFDAVSTIDAPSGPIDALVADHVLSGLVGAVHSDAGGQAMTEQRFLAELVVIAAADPDEVAHLLIAPPRDFDPQTADALLRATAEQPWLGRELPTDLNLVVPEPTARTVLSPAPVVSAIPEDDLTTLINAMRSRDDFASALSHPDAALLPLDRAFGRAATSNRPAEADPQAAVLDVAAAVGALRSTVGIVPPANGTYSLASADAPLVLTVFNNNAFPVTVTVALEPRAAPGVTTTNVEQELPAQTRTTIAVPANVERSGSFTVIATVRTPDGSPLGAPVQLRVQSTVYGPVALAITFGAAALLALLFARRSVQYWRRRRTPPIDLRVGTASGLGGAGGAAQEAQGAEDPARDIATDDDSEPVLVEPPRGSPV